MGRKGPLITLLTGLAVAVVLLTLSATAARRDADRRSTANQGTIVVPTATPEPTPSAAIGSASPAPAPTAVVEALKAAYAGKVKGRGATLAVAINNGRAIAYLCDGKTIEAWLQGTATNGLLALTGARNASLTGAYDRTAVTGSVIARGREWTFDLPSVTKPSGLWRATANVSGSSIVGGWIRLPNGDLVGITTVEGVPEEAAPLDTTTGASSVNGQPLTANFVDASAPL